MKKFGIIRKVDTLGKISIPIEIRRHLGINPGDYLQICMRDDEVICKKYQSDNESIMMHLSALKTYAIQERDPTKQEAILSKISSLQSLLKQKDM